MPLNSLNASESPRTAAMPQYAVRHSVDDPKIRALMAEIGRAATSPGRVYLVGGATAVLLGFRERTIDIDLKLDPEPGAVFEAIAVLKERLSLNVELASPDQFVPALPGWQERSLFIERMGPVEFFHYDPYGQALAKIERGHETDGIDVQSMIETGLVDPKKLRDLLHQVKDQLIRFPAVDARRLLEDVEILAGGK